MGQNECGGKCVVDILWWRGRVEMGLRSTWITQQHAESSRWNRKCLVKMRLKLQETHRRLMQLSN